jgi:hypothetical protein
MDKIQHKLQHFLDSCKTPNILFYGPPGSGKKRLLFEFIDNYVNKWNVNREDYIMVVNCCIHNGIKHIRENITTFAKNNISIKNGSVFKCIILLYADKLTMDAQSAIRRCIEIYNHTTRFFIVVESKNTLMKPIISRFCEIYVPCYNTAYVPMGNMTLLKSWLITLYQSPDIQLTNVIELSRKCYVNGYSLLDIIYLLEETSYLDKIILYHQKFNTLLFLRKIKGEVRNELILLNIAIYSILIAKTKKHPPAFFGGELSCYGNI